MATHTSILAWRIPWTEEPGGPYIVESHMKHATYFYRSQEWRIIMVHVRDICINLKFQPPYIKFYWNTATLIGLHIGNVHFHTITAEVGSFSTLWSNTDYLSLCV